MKYLIFLILALLLTSSYCAYTVDDLDGKIISIKSAHKFGKSYLSSEAWRSADPTTSEN